MTAPVAQVICRGVLVALLGAAVACNISPTRLPGACLPDGGDEDAWPPWLWSQPDGGCAPDQIYRWDDLGGPLPDGGYWSDQRGDLQCHDRCCSDADCTDPARPHCRALAFFAGGDYGCNAWVHVCRATPDNDCAMQAD